MGYEFQVTVDAENPHAQAKWWAKALGWQVEPSNEEMIRGLIESGRAHESDTLVVDGVLVWKVGAAIIDPNAPGRPRVLFQLVPERKTVKNRLHFDVRTGDHREDVVRELEQSGAAIQYRGNQGPFEWVTMTDPEGNEFCVG